MKYIIEDSNSKFIFYNHSLESNIMSIKNELNNISLIKTTTIKELISSIDNQIDFEQNQVSLYDTAVIIYTSGTTGNPKGVVLTHLNLLADAKAISEWFKFNEKTITLCVLPLFHNNGQITTFLAPLYAGGSTVITVGKTNIMNFWHNIKKYKITWTSVMASILSILSSLPFKK